MTGRVLMLFLKPYFGASKNKITDWLVTTPNPPTTIPAPVQTHGHCA
jgi:hypothetical protein